MPHLIANECNNIWKLVHALTYKKSGIANISGKVFKLPSSSQDLI